MQEKSETRAAVLFCFVQIFCVWKWIREKEIDKNSLQAKSFWCLKFDNQQNLMTTWFLFQRTKYCNAYKLLGVTLSIEHIEIDQLYMLISILFNKKESYRECIFSNISWVRILCRVPRWSVQGKIQGSKTLWFKNVAQMMTHCSNFNQPIQYRDKINFWGDRIFFSSFWNSLWRGSISTMVVDAVLGRF